MPFTETQPINIHDLAIEVPAIKAEKLFDPAKDLSEHDKFNISFLRNNHQFPELKSVLLGEKIAIDSNEIEVLKVGFDLSRENMNIKTTIQFASNLQRTGTKVHLTDEEIVTAQLVLFGLNNYFNISFNESEFVCNAKFMNILVSEPTTTINSLKNELAVETDKERYLDIAYKLKILGIHTTVPQSMQESLRSRLNRLSKTNVTAYDFAITAFKMAVVSADELDIYTPGFDLKFNYSSNLNTTPPVPTVRNF